MPRRAGRLLLALLVAWSLLPGGMELVEQAVHLASRGHLAHSIPGDADAPPESDEHGCQPLMHLCHCHQGAAHARQMVTRAWSPPPVRLPLPVWELDDHQDPPARGVFHPPKAGGSAV